MAVGNRKAEGHLVEGQVVTNWKWAREQPSLVHPDRINRHLKSTNPQNPLTQKLDTPCSCISRDRPPPAGPRVHDLGGAGRH